MTDAVTSVFSDYTGVCPGGMLVKETDCDHLLLCFSFEIELLVCICNRSLCRFTARVENNAVTEETILFK